MVPGHEVENVVEVVSAGIAVLTNAQTKVCHGTSETRFSTTCGVTGTRILSLGRGRVRRVVTVAVTAWETPPSHRRATNNRAQVGYNIPSVRPTVNLFNFSAQHLPCNILIASKVTCVV